MQALGADACFDYKSATLEKDVKALGKNVTRAIDCHSEGSSTVLCAQLMGDASGKGPVGRIVRTLPPSMAKGTVPQGVSANEWILAYTALGKACSSFLLQLYYFLIDPLPSTLFLRLLLTSSTTQFRSTLMLVLALLVPLQVLPCLVHRPRHCDQESQGAHWTPAERTSQVCET